VADVLILATSYDRPTWATNRWAHNLEQELRQKGHCCTLVEGADVTRERLERVMNSIRNGLGMRKTEIAREPS
jgi:hypothetical protein